MEEELNIDLKSMSSADLKKHLAAVEKALSAAIKKEVGADSGEIVRNRAFFIIDRSKSDYTTGAFARGDASQLEKVIAIERTIE